MSSTNKLTRKQREKEFHKQQIIESAIKIFAEYGYANATVEKIARDSQFGKGSLYNYFPSKKALFKESFEHAFDQLFNVTKKALSEGKNLHDMLINYAAELIKYFTANRNVFSLLVNVSYNIHLDKSLKKIYDSHILDFNNQLALLFEEHYSKTSSKKLSPIVLAYLFNNYIYSYLLQIVIHSEVIPASDYQIFADDLVFLFLNGLKSYNKAV